MIQQILDNVNSYSRQWHKKKFLFMIIVGTICILQDLLIKKQK